MERNRSQALMPEMHRALNAPDRDLRTRESGVRNVFLPLIAHL
jgi:hypothetical protein